MARRSSSSFAARIGLDWSFVVLALLGTAAAATVALREGRHVFIEVLTVDSLIFLDMLPKVFAGTLIGALVRLLLPRRVIRRYVGESSGLAGLAIATVVGTIFPGGPFTIFPLAAALLIAGADRGVAVAFVTAWLVLGVNRAVIWEMPFLGTDLALTRALWSLPVPLLAGLFARWVPVERGRAEPPP